jgi:hypothetical protein
MHMERSLVAFARVEPPVPDNEVGHGSHTNDNASPKVAVAVPIAKPFCHLHRGRSATPLCNCSLHLVAELWVETTGHVLVLRDGELGEVLVHIEIIDGGFVCKVEPARLGPDAMQATTQVLLRLLLYDLDLEAAAR